MQIGFIGLGQMGQPMAARLLDAGHRITVFNRTRAAANDLETRGARVATTPADMMDAEIVITMVADDLAVQSIWLDRNLAARWPNNAVHVNMSTTSMEIAQQLTTAHARSGSHYVSAPVFGRPAVAAKGELDIIAAGAADVLARCEPIFKVLGKQTFIVGTEPDRANAVKIARNFLLSNMVAGLGEAFALTRKAGVEPNAFLNILTSTSFASPAYRNYGKMIAERTYTPPAFTLTLSLKDVQLALSTAQSLGVKMEVGTLIAELIKKGITAGLGEHDSGALAEYIAMQSGL